MKTHCVSVGLAHQHYIITSGNSNYNYDAMNNVCCVGSIDKIEIYDGNAGKV